MPINGITFPITQVGETHGQWAVDTDENGSPIADASSATFRLWHRDNGRVVVDDSAASILADGSIEYTRQPADVAIAGRYLGRFTVVHVDGSVSKSPTIFITIEP